MKKEKMNGRKQSGKMHAPSVVLGLAGGCLIGAAVWLGMGGASDLNLPFPHADKPAQKTTATTEGNVTVTPSKVMTLAENTIADIASEASKSVVNIDMKRTVAIQAPFSMTPGFGMVDPDSMPKAQVVGAGSGLIIRQDGYVLTNNHVVAAAEEIKVTLDDKRSFMGKVVGRDKLTDLALVKIDTKGLPVAKLGKSKSIRPGDWAIAIGSPMGLDHTVTLGIISALGRSLDDVNAAEMIQTDAAINPGNSGGPLLNIRGEVIGINTAMRGGHAQNIGFAIPVDVFRDVVDELISKGKVARAYVGVYMQEMEPRVAKSLGIPDGTPGVVVAGVAQDGPASQAGMEQGDVIQRVDGNQVDSSKSVQTLVRKHKPGEDLTFLVLRKGKLVPIDVKVDDYPVENDDS